MTQTFLHRRSCSLSARYRLLAITSQETRRCGFRPKLDGVWSRGQLIESWSPRGLKSAARQAAASADRLRGSQLTNFAPRMSSVNEVIFPPSPRYHVPPIQPIGAPSSTPVSRDPLAGRLPPVMGCIPNKVAARRFLSRPERSEESAKRSIPTRRKILRCAQNDTHGHLSPHKLVLERS
jgi:hypothetical protein